MPDDTLRTLLAQHDTAWKLASHHFTGLTTAECLWRPASRGPHVHRDRAGRWRADWPEHEGYDLGPPSIAWITWHIGFWWSMAIDHAFGDGRLTREDVTWPGDADIACEWITGLHREWRMHVGSLGDEELRSTRRTRWPHRDRPFADVVAWVNVELMKNAAEMGYARFLYAVRERPA
jgi:DinB superfamily